MYIWIHDKYSSTSFKQRLWQRIVVLIFQIMCVTLLQWSRSCFHVQINRVWLLFRLFLFSLSPVCSLFLFFFILTADSADHALGSIYILSLSPEFYQFGRGISKALDLHTGLRPDKNQKLSRHVPPLKLLMETAEFFSMLVDIMTNNAKYTTNCTNSHPTPTSDPLAKVKLAFCTSS